MALALSFNDADAARIENYAAMKNMGVFDFVRQAVMKPIDEADEKAARNSEYLAVLDTRIDDVKAGKNTVSFSEKEWEKFANDSELS